MFKKYIMSIADMAGVLGFSIGFFLFLLTGVILGILGFQDLAACFVLLGFIVGIGLAITNSYLKNKYVATVEEYYAPRDGRLYLLKVDKKERVIEGGRKIWGKEGVYPIAIPYGKGTFNTSTRLTSMVGDVFVSVLVELVAYSDFSDEFLEGDVLPQELYTEVIKNGYDGVHEWLSDSFKEAAERTQSVKLAIETHCKDRPYELVNALQQALHDVTFSIRISSISKVEATVYADSTVFTAKATF